MADTIGEKVSPWMETAKGLSVTRSIQFRAGTGANAVRCVNGQAMGAPVPFFYATQYRVRSCAKTKLACQTSVYVFYNVNNRGPVAAYRFPGQVAAWDPFSNVFRTWPL